MNWCFKMLKNLIIHNCTTFRYFLGSSCLYIRGSCVSIYVIHFSLTYQVWLIIINKHVHFLIMSNGQDNEQCMDVRLDKMKLTFWKINCSFLHSIDLYPVTLAQSSSEFFSTETCNGHQKIFYGKNHYCRFTIVQLRHS